MISASYVSACLDVGRGEVIRYLASGISSHPARGLPPPHDTITSYWAPTTCGSQIVAPPKKSKKMRVKSVSLKQQSLTTCGYKMFGARRVFTKKTPLSVSKMFWTWFAECYLFVWLTPFSPMGCVSGWECWKNIQKTRNCRNPLTLWMSCLLPQIETPVKRYARYECWNRGSWLSLYLGSVLC